MAGRTGRPSTEHNYLKTLKRKCVYGFTQHSRPLNAFNRTNRLRRTKKTRRKRKENKSKNLIIPHWSGDQFFSRRFEKETTAIRSVLKRFPSTKTAFDEFCRNLLQLAPLSNIYLTKLAFASLETDEKVGKSWKSTIKYIMMEPRSLHGIVWNYFFGKV